MCHPQQTYGDHLASIPENKNVPIYYKDAEQQWKIQKYCFSIIAD